MNQEEIKSIINKMIDESVSTYSPDAPEKTLKILFKAWDLLPDKKTDWNESFLLSKYITHIYFNTNNIEKATEWCEIFLLCDEAQRGFGESELMMGKIEIRKNNHDQALKMFILANKLSSGRIWSGKKDSEAYKFYKKNE